jgi:hypothetical protein
MMKTFKLVSPTIVPSSYSKFPTDKSIFFIFLMRNEIKIFRIITTLLRMFDFSVSSPLRLFIRFLVIL